MLKGKDKGNPMKTILKDVNSCWGFYLYSPREIDCMDEPEYCEILNEKLKQEPYKTIFYSIAPLLVVIIKNGLDEDVKEFIEKLLAFETVKEAKEYALGLLREIVKSFKMTECTVRLFLNDIFPMEEGLVFDSMVIDSIVDFYKEDSAKVFDKLLPMFEIRDVLHKVKIDYEKYADRIIWDSESIQMQEPTMDFMITNIKTMPMSVITKENLSYLTEKECETLIVLKKMEE